LIVNIRKSIVMLSGGSKRRSNSPENKRNFILSGVLIQIGQRTDAIVGNKYRGSYYKAAQLLTAAAETLANRGRKQEGLDLVERYRYKYFRHSAFKGEIVRLLKLSRLFCG
jgi:hypothetical protein